MNSSARKILKLPSFGNLRHHLDSDLNFHLEEQTPQIFATDYPFSFRQRTQLFDLNTPTR